MLCAFLLVQPQFVKEGRPFFHNLRLRVERSSEAWDRNQPHESWCRYWLGLRQLRGLLKVIPQSRPEQALLLMDFLMIAWVLPDPLMKTPRTGHLEDEADY